jgi:hypothetical protein
MGSFDTGWRENPTRMACDLRALRVYDSSRSLDFGRSGGDLHLWTRKIRLH